MGLTVSDLDHWLEGFAPRVLAEPWDNVGLLVGDPASPVRRVMTCLTLTADVAAEAVEGGADAVVSHHPVMFRPIKRLRADEPDTAVVWMLARAGIAILSPHTAFDNAVGGMNDGLATRLQLRDVRPIRPGLNSKQWKVVAFVPADDHVAVLLAAFQAGAGRIGEYNECSFTVAGRGTFLGSEASHPEVGQAGRRMEVRERRIEFVCPDARLASVVTAIRGAHRYEEPAIDVVALRDGPPTSPGVGRVGVIEPAETLEVLARKIQTTLRSSRVEFAGDPRHMVRTLAIVCGAGDDFLADARLAGADALFTGEARLHRAIEARELDMGLILAGHHATERPGVEDLAVWISEAFAELDVWASRRERDPLQPV